ncbi:TPA: patatin-like phospholipase family protein [Vibrio antiquarius]
MKPSTVRIAIIVCVLSLLSACGSYQKNPPLTEYDKDYGYRFEKLNKDGNSDNLFVIVSFSGGGTRAAAFSYGVLEGLRASDIHWGQQDKKLLNEVDVISSISGGSFTAAYYGLFRDKIFTEFPEKFLYRPIEDELKGLLYSPTNLLKLAGGSYGRSDLAADFYNKEIFEEASFDTLVTQGKRPLIEINATDMTLGSPFNFTQDQFDLICSNLSDLSVARAVASSSAFPGLLTPLTFKNYAGSCNYTQPSWVESAMKDYDFRTNPRRTTRAENRLSYTATGKARRDYIHLTDGGVADNIGLRVPLEAMRSVNHPWSIQRLLNNDKIDRLVVIVVNAATNPDTERDKTPDVPGLIDTIKTSATVPLDNYSVDTLELLKATVDEYNAAVRLVDACKSIGKKNKPTCQLAIDSPHRVEIYPIQVDFDRITNAERRAYFKNLPTNFQLPRKTIKNLIDAGQEILASDPEYKRLMKDIGRH